MRLSLGLLLIILGPALAGCDSHERSVEKIINDCQYEAFKLYANSSLTGDGRRTEREQFTNTCLKKNGLRAHPHDGFTWENCLINNTEPGDPLRTIGNKFYTSNSEVCWAK